jgi:hypothetical protein
MNQGTSCRVHDDTVENFALGRLKGNSLTRFEQHLLLCAECQERVEQADVYVAVMRTTLQALRAEKAEAERRREPRRACRRKVQVKMSGARRLVEAHATDMSKSGLGLMLGMKVLAGAKVLLAMGARQYKGEVAWCSPEGDQYRVGVRLAA